MLERAGVSLNVVTKVVSSHPEVLARLYRAGVRVFSDSRVASGARIREWAERVKANDIVACLLRPPSEGELDVAVRMFDRFYVSTIEAARALDEEAARQRKRIELVLMVETGDEREGFLEGELSEAIAALSSPGVLTSADVVGLGTNQACLTGKGPEPAEIVRFRELTEKYCGAGALCSAGNSSTLYLAKKRLWPRNSVQVIEELRVGEALFLGWDTVSYEPIGGLATDAFEVAAEVLEVRTKGYGKMQVLVALGRADVAEGRIYPLDMRLREIRRSSDHCVLVLDEDREAQKSAKSEGARGDERMERSATDALRKKDSTRDRASAARADGLCCDITSALPLKQGDVVRFGVSYFALLAAMMSPYVRKRFVD
jgi:predicted amino acid racemase